MRAVVTVSVRGCPQGERDLLESCPGFVDRCHSLLGWSVQKGIEKLPEAPVWLIEQAPGRQSDKAGSSERAKCVAQVRTETAGAAD